MLDFLLVRIRIFGSSDFTTRHYQKQDVDIRLLMLKHLKGK